MCDAYQNRQCDDDMCSDAECRGYEDVDNNAAGTRSTKASRVDRLSRPSEIMSLEELENIGRPGFSYINAYFRYRRKSMTDDEMDAEDDASDVGEDVGTLRESVPIFNVAMERLGGTT